MIKRLFIGAAMGALMTSAALAQQSPGTAPSSTPTTPPAATEKPSAATLAESKEVVTSQQPDQWLASKFRGTEVLGTDDKKIGEIGDILFDKEGKILAYVVSTGGFLGMGAKEVALPPNAFEIVQGQNGAEQKLKIAMSQNDLKQAENFKPYEPPRATTTGSGGERSGQPPTSTTPSGR